MVRFHGDGIFTWDMIHSPCFVYLSSEYKNNHSAVANNLRVNENRIFTNDLIYDMVCGIMGRSIMNMILYMIFPRSIMV